MELRQKFWNLQTPHFASKIGGLEVSEFLPKLHLFGNCYKLTYTKPPIFAPSNFAFLIFAVSRIMDLPWNLRIKTSIFAGKSPKFTKFFAKLIN